MREDFGISRLIIENSPAQPVGENTDAEVSEWDLPTDFDGVKGAIIDTRVLMGGIVYVNSVILQDLNSADLESNIHDLIRLEQNLNDLLKALQIGVFRIFPSAVSRQRIGIQSQMKMLFTLATSVEGLLTSIKHALRDMGSSNIYMELVNDAEVELKKATDKIEKLFDFVNEHH